MVQVEWSQEANAKLVEYLNRYEYEIPSGLGTEEAACSVAAINLALSGEFTDRVPDCMSKVIGVWIIRIQDAMPATMRNSREWKELLPLAANTGREWEQEKKRLDIIVEWMWTVLHLAQPVADTKGYGDAFRRVCKERTVEALNVLGENDSYIATHIATRVTSIMNCYAKVCNIKHDDPTSIGIANATSTSIDAFYIVASVTAMIADDMNDDNTITCKTIDPVDTLRRLVSV